MTNDDRFRLGTLPGLAWPLTPTMLASACLALLVPASAAAQGPTCIDSLPKPNNCYKLYVPTGTPRGLVVLLPGFGDTTELFDLFEFPKMMQRRGYLVAAVSMARPRRARRT